jgi:hypothetical protein
MNDSDTRWLIPLLLAAAAGLAIWYTMLDGELPFGQPAEVQPVETSPEEPATRLGPIHPMPPSDSTAGAEDLVPLPPLGDSDAYFKLALVDLFGAGVDGLLVEQALIEKFVTTIDNLPRRHVSEQIRPVGRIGGAFRADPAGAERPEAEQVYALSEENYTRYDGIINTLLAADDDELVDVYRRFYPLFQEAYVSIGYPNGYFNDRAVEVIDQLLAAPEPEGPIYLVRSNVLYEFVDPMLEELSAGEKLMIRIGPSNADKVKARLAALRERIAQ